MFGCLLLSAGVTLGVIARDDRRCRSRSARRCSGGWSGRSCRMRPGPGIAQVLFLKLDERHGAGVVGVGQVECESVGLVLLVTAVGQRDRG